MAVLGQQRSTPLFPGEGVIPSLIPLGLAAGVKIWAGGIVCTNAAGYAQPASTAGGVVCWGRAEPAQNLAGSVAADNTSGTNGALTLQIRQGVFKFLSGASTDLIASTNAGQDCYVIDDVTVGLTDGGGTRIRAGKVCQVDSDGGVWVLMGAFLRDIGVGGGEAAGSTVPFVFDLADIAAGDIVSKFTPGFGGRIKSFQAVVLKAATTAAKAATITPQINPAGGADVAVTGGALALTSANMTPGGAVVAAAAITGANTFGAGDSISLKASSVTAFVEGRVLLSLTFA